MISERAEQECSPCWGRARCLHGLVWTGFHCDKLISVDLGLLIQSYGHYGMQWSHAAPRYEENRVECRNTSTGSAALIVQQRRRTADIRQLASGPRVYDLWPAAPDMQCVPNKKEQGPPFSARTLPCRGFASFVSIRLQVPSTCLHWPVALAVGHLAPGKGCEATGTGHSCSSPELERSTCNSRFSTLGVTTQHPTLLMLTKCSRHGGGGIKKIELEKGAPGPVWADTISVGHTVMDCKGQTLPAGNEQGHSIGFSKSFVDENYSQ